MERSKRLTASLFGSVIKRRPYTPCHSLVKSCLQQKVFHTDAVEYGIMKESIAIKHFESAMGLYVKPSGLWIDEEYGFLAASPDGWCKLYCLLTISYHCYIFRNC